MALFGFIDPIHPYDYYPLRIDVPKDNNVEYKRKYFVKEWNTTYTQQNATNKIKDYCFLHHDQSSWYALGRTPQQYQNRNRIKGKREDRTFSPPLDVQYYGQTFLKIHGNFLKFIRLTLLPAEHFDSFTISSILNHFEFDYLEKFIDPSIRAALNSICIDQLTKYPTTIKADQLELRRIERERKTLINSFELNANKNLTETQRLKEIISSLDRHSVALQYRIREKSFLDKCSKLYFEPSQQLLKTVKRRKPQNKAVHVQKPKQKKITTGLYLMAIIIMCCFIKI